MEYTKQPITLAEQINILKQRGLIFENENEALSGLNSINPQNTFVQDFKSLLKKYSSVQPSMMGFPRGWENEPLWQ